MRTIIGHGQDACGIDMIRKDRSLPELCALVKVALEEEVLTTAHGRTNEPPHFWYRYRDKQLIPGLCALVDALYTVELISDTEQRILRQWIDKELSLQNGYGHLYGSGYLFYKQMDPNVPSTKVRRIRLLESIYDRPFWMVRLRWWFSSLW